MAQFLAGQLPLRQFNRWFVPAVWDIEQEKAPKSLKELVYGVKAALDEYDNHYWDNNGLRRQFAIIIGSYNIAAKSAMPIANSKSLNFIQGSYQQIFPIQQAASPSMQMLEVSE